MAEERIQRRLAAILAADVVGYSRLMEADEAGTLAALKSRRRDVLDPLVARHQGRIFKITGDGVLVEFAQRRQCRAMRRRSATGWPRPMAISQRIATSCCASASIWAT